MSIEVRKPPDVRAAPRVRDGFSLVELAIVLAIMGIITLIAAPNVIAWQEDQRLRGAARDLADLIRLARSEATRTGNRHIMVYGPAGTTEPGGTTLDAAADAEARALVFGDGAPATSDCQLAAAEPREWLPPVRDVDWGVSLATARAPGDAGAAPFAPPQASGGTTADPALNPVPWLMFRPDGVPVTFQGTGGSCGAIGATAQGGAAFYLTNGRRDYGVVLTAMGGVRVHVWDAASGAWSS